MPGRAKNNLDALVAARDAAERLGDLEAQADVERQLSFTLYIYGEVRRALEAANRSEACLRALPRPPLDRQPAMGLAGAALLLLGNLREASRRWTSFIHERRQHHDLMTMTWVHGHPARFPLLLRRRRPGRRRCGARASSAPARETHRNAHLDFVTTSIRDLGTTPTGALTKRKEAQLLELALQRIPMDQQIALELTYWEELSAHEVARVLDISDAAAHSIS